MQQVEEILYRRRLAAGPEVRIRRTSGPGEIPVVAVLHVERRAGTPRELLGTPPPLKQVEGPSEDEVVLALKPEADNDRTVAGLMFAKGMR